MILTERRVTDGVTWQSRIRSKARAVYSKHRTTGRLSETTDDLYRPAILRIVVKVILCKYFVIHH